MSMSEFSQVLFGRFLGEARSLICVFGQLYYLRALFQSYFVSVCTAMSEYDLGLLRLGRESEWYPNAPIRVITILMVSSRYSIAPIYVTVTISFFT